MKLSIYCLETLASLFGCVYFSSLIFLCLFATYWYRLIFRLSASRRTRTHPSLPLLIVPGSVFSCPPSPCCSCILSRRGKISINCPDVAPLLRGTNHGYGNRECSTELEHAHISITVCSAGFSPCFCSTIDCPGDMRHLIGLF